MNRLSASTGNGGRLGSSSCHSRSSRPLRNSLATMQTGTGRAPGPAQYSKSTAHSSRNGSSSTYSSPCSSRRTSWWGVSMNRSLKATWSSSLNVLSGPAGSVGVGQPGRPEEHHPALADAGEQPDALADVDQLGAQGGGDQVRLAVEAVLSFVDQGVEGVLGGRMDAEELLLAGPADRHGEHHPLDQRVVGVDPERVGVEGVDGALLLGVIGHGAVLHGSSLARAGWPA